MTYFYTLAKPDDDLPIHVDDTTVVHLTADDYEIVISQDMSTVVVRDVEALTRALTQVQIIQAERQAMDDRPMTDDMRKAIFAGLAGLYGKSVNTPAQRQRRLSIISAIVGRKVETLSTANTVMYDVLTRAEASHVLDVLNA